MGVCCGKLPYEDLQEPEVQPKWVEKTKTTEHRIDKSILLLIKTKSPSAETPLWNF